MGYIDKSLLPGECVVVRGKCSGWAYIGPVVLLVLGLATAVFLVGIILIIVSIVAMVKLASVEIGATNRRVIGKIGAISTNSLDLRLSKLEGISVTRSLFGTMFNFGTIVINGTGQTRMRFPGITNPERLRRAFLSAAESQSQEPSTGMQKPISHSESTPARFQVQIVDRKSGEENWIEVRALNEQDAIQKATQTGAIVGQCRLLGID